MYRRPIGPVSAIERAIVCMRMSGLADLRQPISRGFLHTATSGGAPGFFYARCARNQVDRKEFNGATLRRLQRHGARGADEDGEVSALAASSASLSPRE